MQEFLEVMILCTSCERLISGQRKCKAYPGGIPPEIWGMTIVHTDPYIGDNGLQYKVAKNEEEIEINSNDRFVEAQDFFLISKV